jgi:hypothetical protein
MGRCPKCRTQFFTKNFKCSCGAVFKNNIWTNLFDIKTVINMNNLSFQNIYLYYIKDLPDIIQDEMGVALNLKKYIGYKKIKTLKNHVVLIFRYTEKNETRYIAWNINSNMIYRCKANKKETLAFIGDKQINNLEEWVRSLVGEV